MHFRGRRGAGTAGIDDGLGTHDGAARLADGAGLALRVGQVAQRYGGIFPIPASLVGRRRFAEDGAGAVEIAQQQIGDADLLLRVGAQVRILQLLGQGQRFQIDLQRHVQPALRARHVADHQRGHQLHTQTLAVLRLQIGSLRLALGFGIAAQRGIRTGAVGPAQGRFGAVAGALVDGDGAAVAGQRFVQAQQVAQGQAQVVGDNAEQGRIGLYRRIGLQALQHFSRIVQIAFAAHLLRLAMPRDRAAQDIADRLPGSGGGMQVATAFRRTGHARQCIGACLQCLRAQPGPALQQSRRLVGLHYFAQPRRRARPCRNARLRRQRRVFRTGKFATGIGQRVQYGEILRRLRIGTQQAQAKRRGRQPRRRRLQGPAHVRAVGSGQRRQLVGPAAGRKIPALHILGIALDQYIGAALFHQQQGLAASRIGLQHGRQGQHHLLHGRRAVQPDFRRGHARTATGQRGDSAQSQPAAARQRQ